MTAVEFLATMVVVVALTATAGGPDCGYKTRWRYDTRSRSGGGTWICT